MPTCKASQSSRVTIQSLMNVADDSSTFQSPRCSPRGMEDIDFFDYDDVIATPRDHEEERETGLHEGDITQQALLRLHAQQSKKIILTSRGYRYLDDEPDPETIEMFKGIGDQMLANVHTGLDTEELFDEPFGKEVRVFKIPEEEEFGETFMIIYRGVIFSGMRKGKALSIFIQQIKNKLLSEIKDGEDPGFPKSISMTDDNDSYLWQIEQEQETGLQGITTRLFHLKMPENTVSESEDSGQTEITPVTDDEGSDRTPVMEGV